MKRLIIIRAFNPLTPAQRSQIMAEATRVHADGGVLLLPYGWTWQVVDADDIEIRVDAECKPG